MGRPEVDGGDQVRLLHNFFNGVGRAEEKNIFGQGQLWPDGFYQGEQVVGTVFAKKEVIVITIFLDLPNVQKQLPNFFRAEIEFVLPNITVFDMTVLL